MSNMLEYVATMLRIRSNAGVTAIEYGMIVGLIAVAIVSALTLLGSNAPAVLNDPAAQSVLSGT